METKTFLAGQLARAANLNKVSEIIVYRDTTEAAEDEGRERELHMPCVCCLRVSLPPPRSLSRFIQRILLPKRSRQKAQTISLLTRTCSSPASCSTSSVRHTSAENSSSHTRMLCLLCAFDAFYALCFYAFVLYVFYCSHDVCLSDFVCI